MDGRDLASAACTCRAWREAVGALQREGAWRDALFREFTPYPEYRTTRTEVQAEFSCFDEPALRPVWREQYRRMFTAHRNWQQGRATHETHALPWTSGEGVLSCKLAEFIAERTGGEEERQPAVYREDVDFREGSQPIIRDRMSPLTQRNWA